VYDLIIIIIIIIIIVISPPTINTNLTELTAQRKAPRSRGAFALMPRRKQSPLNNSFARRR